MKNTCQDQNDSLHTPNIEKEKIEAAIQWIEDGAGFAHIREVPELLKESVQDHIFQSAEGHLEELVSNHKITLDEVAHAYHLMQISQGQLEWTRELVADTRIVLGNISEWASKTLLEDLKEQLDEITRQADPVLANTDSGWDR